MPYKRGQKWIAQARKGVMRKQKTFVTKKEAMGWEVAQKKLPPEEWNGKIPMVCLLDWATAYLNYARKFTEKTYKEKRAMFKLFLKHTGVGPEMPAEDLKAGHVLAYLQDQFEARSGYAANKDRKNLVAAWNWGMKYMGLPAPNPCLVDRFPEKRQRRYVPPEKDFWKVYDVAEGQDKVMLLAYLHLAARRGELFRLRWEDVDFGEQRVRLYTRKRSDGTLEYDWLPMTEELFDTLLFHRQKASTEWVFPEPDTGKPYRSRRTWMRALCKKAEVKAFGTHAIRHLTASILAQGNKKRCVIRNLKSVASLASKL
ncbi:MAG: tyrosine-type recombinase/integrase [Deltaproteobacteria bacterium]